MNKAELEGDWLANNAVVAFVGALLLAQSWQPSDGAPQLHFDITAITWLDVIIALLFTLSLLLALASIIPLLRFWVLRHVSPLVSPLLALLTWLAFILGWLQGSLELPLDQLRSQILFLGGFLFFIFLGYRVLCSYLLPRETPSD